MNIRDLEYVVALQKHGSFGKAAKACFVSQPTLSGQLKKLEKELGGSLLERNTKGIVFSELGLDVLSRAERILAEVEQIEETAKMMKDPRGGRMRIGIIPTICSFLLPHILKSLRKTFPAMRFSFHEFKTHEIMSELQEGKLDAGVLALPLHVDALIEIPIYNESFMCCVPTGHSIATKKKVREDQMSGENMLLLNEGHCFRDQALEICSKFPGLHNQEMNGTSLETLVSMVSMNEGITLVPELASVYWSKRKDIKFVPIENPVPQREIGLIYRRYSPRFELFEEIGHAIQKSVTSQLSQTKKQKRVLPVI